MPSVHLYPNIWPLVTIETRSW